MPSSEAPAVPAERWRLRLAREASASHLDQVAALRRAVEESGLPLAQSGGRRARPKLAFGPALSAGHESEAEYLDLWLSKRTPRERVSRSLSGTLPSGWRLLEARKIPVFYPSVEALATLAVDELRFMEGPPPAAGLQHPAVVKLEAGPGKLEMTYRIGPRGARAEDILDTWFGEGAWKRKLKLRRTKLWVETPEGGTQAP